MERKTFDLKDLSFNEIPPKKKILKLLSNKEIIIKACDGSETVIKSKELFNGGIHYCFGEWGNDSPSPATKATSVVVYITQSKAKHSEMFYSLGDDLNKLCLTQHQIIIYCTNHQNWLRADPYASFFLFKSNEDFYVAVVFIKGQRLKISIEKFGYAFAWPGEKNYYVIVPKIK